MEGVEKLKNMAVDFYRKLFKASPCIQGNFITGYFPDLE